MLRPTAILAAVVVLLLEASPALGQRATGAARSLSVAEIAKSLAPALVQITTASGTGSGILVAPSGVIVTSLHVLRGESKASVRLANGDIYDDIDIVDVDERKDLLVLKIKGFNLPTAPIGDSDRVEIGDKVVVISSPRGLMNSISEGVVSGIRDSGEGYRLLQTTAAASPGSSGGGVFDERGQLVGIVAAKLREAENINFAVPVNYARGLIGPTPSFDLQELARRFPGDASPQSLLGSDGADDSRQIRERLAGAIAASGIEFDSVGDSTWKASFEGDNADTITVYVSLYSDYVVTQCTVADAATLSAKQMAALLEFNFEADQVKAALSNGELVVLNETEAQLVDGPRLKRLVAVVGLGADHVVGLLDNSPEVVAYTPLKGPPPGRMMALRLLGGGARLTFNQTYWLENAQLRKFGRYARQHVSGELWFRVVEETASVPLSDMAGVALRNAQDVDPNARIVRQGWRDVNGVRMLVLEIEATSEGVPLWFYGHYYSNREGTLQIVGWTAKDAVYRHRSTVDLLVSGFQVVR